MRLAVLYGSQTGTAQDVAEQIWRESKCWGFNGPVLPMDEYPIQQLIDERLAVFVVATTGNGVEPDNMKETWRFLLRRNLPAQLLCGLQFACLGLGDSSYATFNYTAKKLNKRLIQLGAKPVHYLGLCDDQHDHGLSAASLPWIAQLWTELKKLLSLRQPSVPTKSETVFKWKVYVLEKSSEIAAEEQLQWPFKDLTLPFILKENQRLTNSNHFQDVRLFRFEFPPSISWRAGDVLQLRPYNSEENVNSFFSLVVEHNLNFNESTIVQIESTFEEMQLPIPYRQPVTVKLLVKYVWDLNALPRQRTFQLLSLNCEDELEKEKLDELASAEGLDDFINYINRPRRKIIEVLQDFRHATSKLTLPILFELLPIIQPRSFSIASLPISGTLDLLVAVVEYKTKMSTPRLGLCSNWLKLLPARSRLLGVLKTGTMILPQDPITPIIMVGPGTGIAPFRSIIQYKEMQQKNNIQIGPLIVFFGCRNKKNDFYFSEEFTRWQVNHLLQIFTAFSRDQKQKIYVQHLIKEQKLFLNELIMKKNAIIYVAGSSNNMPKSVREAFIEVVGDEKYIDKMVNTKRYQEETWS